VAVLHPLYQIEAPLTWTRQAWKAHILFLHADDAHKQRGIAETLELCNAEPPTTDLDTLQKMFRTLQKLDGHGETRSRLWERAAKAKPQDLEIQLEWFTTSFESNDWKSAQKVSSKILQFRTLSISDEMSYLTIIFLVITGSDESPEKLPKGAEVLLLGHRSHSSAGNGCRELGYGTQAFWNIGVSNDLKSSC